jgi:hypothetical protein
MKPVVLLSTMALVVWVGGCQSEEHQDFVRLDQTTISLDAAVRMADEKAEKALAEANIDPLAPAPDKKTAIDPHSTFQREQAGQEGHARLTLGDYRRRVSVGTRGNRPEVWVHYTCSKPLGWLGAWTHFSILVYLDSKETEWFGGM